MMTFAPSRQPDLLPMELPLTQFAAGFRAKAFQLAGQAAVLTTSAAAYGRNTPVLLARLDRKSSSWRTAQTCFLETAGNGLARFSQTWPRSGMMRNGELSQLPMLERPTFGSASGLLPTPLASDNRDRGNILMPSIQRRLRIGKQTGLSMLFAKAPCPMCVEGMMGFPAGWTDCTPLETP